MRRRELYSTRPLSLSFFERGRKARGWTYAASRHRARSRHCRMGSRRRRRSALRLSCRRSPRRSAEPGKQTVHGVSKKAVREYRRPLRRNDVTEGELGHLSSVTRITDNLRVAYTVVGIELAVVVNPALAPCADGGDSQHAVEDHLAPVPRACSPSAFSAARRASAHPPVASGGSIRLARG